MATMTKEDRYVLRLGGVELELQVQELVWGSESWPERCRVALTARDGEKPVTFYGATGREAVERAAEYLLRFTPSRISTLCPAHATGKRQRHVAQSGCGRLHAKPGKLTCGKQGDRTLERTRGRLL